MDRKHHGVSLESLDRPQPLYLQAYQRLREAIIDGRLEPGQRLVETEVAASLNVSRTPIREALRKLEQDGLVRIVDGFAEVFRPAESDVFSIYTCRAAIEGMAAYLAARNVTGDDLRDLESIHLRLAEAHDRRDTRACVELNTRFHDQIISLARDPWLAKMYAMLRVHALLVRYYNLDHHSRRELVVEHHEAILKAIAAQDADQARRAMEAHIVANREAAMSKVAHALKRQSESLGGPERSGTAG